VFSGFTPQKPQSGFMRRSDPDAPTKRPIAIPQSARRAHPSSMRASCARARAASSQLSWRGRRHPARPRPARRRQAHAPHRVRPVPRRARRTLTPFALRRVRALLRRLLVPRSSLLAQAGADRAGPRCRQPAQCKARGRKAACAQQAARERQAIGVVRCAHAQKAGARAGSCAGRGRASSTPEADHMPERDDHAQSAHQAIGQPEAGCKGSARSPKPARGQPEAASRSHA